MTASIRKRKFEMKKKKKKNPAAAINNSGSSLACRGAMIDTVPAYLCYINSLGILVKQKVS